MKLITEKPEKEGQDDSATVRTSLSYQLVSIERERRDKEGRISVWRWWVVPIVSDVLQPPPPRAKKKGRAAHYLRKRPRRRAGPIVVLSGVAAIAALVPRGARHFLLHPGAEKIRKSSSPRECTGPRWGARCSGKMSEVWVRERIRWGRVEGLAGASALPLSTAEVRCQKGWRKLKLEKVWRRIKMLCSWNNDS
jgi:hypothetical protein